MFQAARGNCKFNGILIIFIWICKKRVKESSADKTIYKYLVGKWYNAEKTRIHAKRKEERRKSLDLAIKKKGEDTPVWCMIYDDLKYKEEAHIFADQQKHVKALSSFETLRYSIHGECVVLSVWFVYQLNYNTGRPIRLSFYHLL